MGGAKRFWQDWGFRKILEGEGRLEGNRAWLGDPQRWVEWGSIVMELEGWLQGEQGHAQIS